MKGIPEQPERIPAITLKKKPQKTDTVETGQPEENHRRNIILEIKIFLEKSVNSFI